VCSGKIIMADKKITKKTKISDLITQNSEVVEILFQRGLGCIGCPMAMMETLEQGLKAHGMNNKEIEKIIKELNKKIEKSRPN